jgi:hypothetical protein
MAKITDWGDPEQQTPRYYTPISGGGAPPPPKEKPTTTRVFRDPKTGRTTGVELPDGRVFMGLSPDEVRKITGREALKRETPFGAEEFGGLDREELARGVGVGLPGKTPEQIRLDWAQATGAGGAAIIPGLAAGAAAGAIAGAAAGPAAPVTVPGGAAIGAIVGGVGTFTNAFIGNLRTQQSDFIGREVFNLRDAKSNLRVIIQNTNMGAEPLTQIEAFNEQLSFVDQAHSNVKQEANEGKRLLGKDGARELEKFESFYAPGGFRDVIIDQFQQALINPNPNKISIDFDSLT